MNSRGRVLTAALLLFFFFFFSLAVKAQEAAPSALDEAAVVERQLTKVRFENDGTSVREITSSIRILNQAGIERFGQIIEGYSSDIETLDGAYVRVRKPNGDVVPTPKENAQDFAPEVLESAPTYSDFRQRHITVAGLRPGDVLEYHLIVRSKKPLADGQFWFEYSFPEWVAIDQARVEIDVPKARQIILKSPKKKYTTEDNGDRRTYAWEVDKIRPDRKKFEQRLRGEDVDDSDADDDTPDIQLTTFANWQEVAKWYAKLQGQRVVVDAAIRAKAEELTKGAPTPGEKIRRLYDYVARNIRYVSLSFGIGALQPHAAPDVMKGGYGDCKDKHTLLQALLRAAGIESYPVLIHSSRKLDRDVPSPAQFDHEITAVRLGSDLMWLDTTAEVLPFGMLEYELRRKEALLVVDGAEGGVKRAPSSVPIKNTMVFSMQGKVSETGTLDATIDLTGTGDSAFMLRATLRRIAPADWDRFAKAVSAADTGTKVSDIDIGPLEEPSKPLRMHYRLHQENYFHVPSANANFFPFPAMGFPRLAARTKGNEPLDIGPAVEVTQHVHLELPPNFSLRVPTEVSLTREYAEFTTSSRVTGNILDAQRRMLVKVDELPQSKRADVEALRSVLLNIAAQTIICSIRPASQAAMALNEATGDTPEELRKAATKAMQQRNYQMASELLKKAVEKEPDSKTSWDDLGRAYARIGDHTAAVAAFRKQTEVNPNHKSAFRNLGDELQEMGQTDEAIVAYKKGLDAQPLDAAAHKSLGLLLLQTKRDKDAAEQLEAALAVPPGDAEAQLALARAYLNTGETAKAKTLLAAAIGDVASYPDDLYAAALTDNADPAASQQNARKILDDMGDEFDSGTFADNPPAVFAAMHHLALQWARVGWAMAKQGQTLNGIRYLESAWYLSQSGVVAERLAEINQQAGRTAEANRWYSRAAAAGNDTAREQLKKASGADFEKQLQAAKSELAALRTVKLSRATAKTGNAQFNVIFDGTDKPDRTEFWSGDEALRSVMDALVASTYHVMFPDVSSIKIVRRVAVSCTATGGCTATLLPIDAVEPAVRTAQLQVK